MIHSFVFDLGGYLIGETLQFRRANTISDVSTLIPSKVFLDDDFYVNILY